MDKKYSVTASLLILIGVMLMATACAGGVRVGDLQTRSQTVKMDGADSIDVEILMGAGELDISGGASDLLEASFAYNVGELNPQATYSNGTLEVRDSDVKEGIGSLFDLDEYLNEWDLRFNENVPMEMTIDLGAGSSNLSLGALSLTHLNIDGGAGEINLALNSSQSLSRLDFNMGAGEVTIDLTGKWQNDLDARLEGGLGEITVRLPNNVGVRIDVQTGIGGVHASGLSKDGDTYTNDAYGESDVTLRIEIDGGVGQINLESDTAYSGCPEPDDKRLLWADETLGFCLLYPASHTVVQQESGNTEIVVSEVMNHIDPRISITSEDLAGQSLAQVVDDFLSGYEGFEIDRSDMMVGGQEAVLLDGVPGQDYYRILFVAHGSLLFKLSFAPYDPNLDNLAQAEQLYALAMGSFRFTTP